MTDLGNVNVTLGLNSDEFVKAFAQADDKLKGLEKELNKSKQQFQEVSMAMAGTNKPSKELVNTYNKLKEKLKENQSAFDKFNSKLSKLDGGLTQNKQAVTLLQGALGKLAVGFSAITITNEIFELGKAAVETAGKFEKLAVSFEVLSGGAEAGKKLTNQIIELAAKTPLTTEALSDGARTLLSFGEASNEVINDLKLLGDITGGDVQRMQSLTLAFAQVGSTGKLAGQELLQMINAGFNPLAIISEKTGKSMAQLKDEMSKGLITFNDVKEAMIAATSEGGRFYGMMNKQSETLDGRISTLSDNWDLLNKKIGDKFLPYIKEAINKLIELANKVENPLNTHLTILDGSLQSIGNAFKGIRDIIGHLIPGTNNLSNLFATMSTNAAKLGLTLQYVLAPLEVLQNGKTFEDVGKRIQKLNAQWRGLDDAYMQTLSGKKPALDFSGQDEIIEKYKNSLKGLSETTKETQKGFSELSGGGTTTGKTTTQAKQDKALEEYKKYIDEYNKLNDNYAATLQARQYVEGTLNIDPVTQQQEYDQLINIYTNYFAKITEISKSGAKNKAEILKLAETNLQDELQKIQIDKTLETQRELYNIQKGYADTRKDIAIKNQAESELGGFIGRFSTGYQERLQLLQWYYKERERITDLHYDNLEAKQQAFNDLEQTTILKNVEIEKDIWTKRGEELTSIFNQTFDSMLTNYGDFSENMQQLAINLSRYLIKEAFQSFITQMALFKGSEGGILSAFTNIFNSANSMSNSLLNMAQSAAVANASTMVMTTTQTALSPIQKKNSESLKTSANNYAIAAQSAQELAVSIAKLAVSEAAYSVAKIPYIGGFLAPAAATLTGSAIAAATAMVAGISKGAGLLNKVGGGLSGSSISGGGGTAIAMNTGIGPIARYDLSETLPKYHSGGLSTNEQLAILQRNERVLNPAETVNYNGTQDDMGNAKVNNVMMFNIKAWDGKDVINTLKANSQTINQIVSSGIKNNQQGLRTTVQNL